MGLRKYIGNILKLAFRHSFGLSDTIASFIGLAIGAAKHYFPHMKFIMNIEAWQILLWIFGAIIVGRLLLAPYWLYRQVEKERDELQIELRKNKSVPKLPSPPELHLDYLSSQIGMEDNVHIITVSAWYRATNGKMRISQVELRLIGKTIPPVNWTIIEVSQDLWYGPDTKFKLPDGISPGEHSAELFAFANEQWWGPYTFMVSVPEVKH